MSLGVTAWIAMRAGAQALGGLRVPPPDPTIWGFQPSTPEHPDLQQRLTLHPIKTMLDAPKLGDRRKGVSKGTIYWRQAFPRRALPTCALHWPINRTGTIAASLADTA